MSAWGESICNGNSQRTTDLRFFSVPSSCIVPEDSLSTLRNTILLFCKQKRRIQKSSFINSQRTPFPSLTVYKSATNIFRRHLNDCSMRHSSTRQITWEANNKTASWDHYSAKIIFISCSSDAELVFSLFAFFLTTVRCCTWRWNFSQTPPFLSTWMVCVQKKPALHHIFPQQYYENEKKMQLF